MRGKWLLVAGTLILAAGGGALTWLKRGAAREAATVMKTPAAVPAVQELSFPGKIQAQHMVPVGAAVTGAVEAFLADVGQDVSEGQLLARIGSQGLESARDEAARTAQNAQEKVNSIGSRIIAERLEASRAQADANRARDQFERAEKTYLRQQALNREGATPRLVYEKSQRELETARTEFTSLAELARQAGNRVDDLVHDLEAAKRVADDRSAELETAATQAAGAEIRSSVSGIVVARQGEIGTTLGPEEAKRLFEIAVDLAHLEVEIQPDGAALKRIRAGQDALVFVADFPGAIPGSVKEVKAGGAMVEFVSPSAVIRPGMTAEVRLRLE
jgi:HlyD family secretion protein